MPNGLTIIPPRDVNEQPKDVPVTLMCSIATDFRRFLEGYSVYTYGYMKKLPKGVLTKRFGN